MTRRLDPADEPPIDTSLTHYMEERALAVALSKAATPAEVACVQRLLDAQRALALVRQSFDEHARTMRHARGEVYSPARVAAIQAMGPTKAQLERDAAVLYERQRDCASVLEAHARTHFGFVLMSMRINLAHCTPDIADAARDLQRHEEAFAAAWVAAIGQEDFKLEMQRCQREALSALRSSTRPMYFVSFPDRAGLDDAQAQVLGKAWKKLDEWAQADGVEPLSSFIALPDEGESAGVPASLVLRTVDALLAKLQDRSQKMASRTATIAVLTKLQRELRELAREDGRACFEIDL